MFDPTYNELRDALDRTDAGNEADEFDKAEAIYWFAHDYHGGQWSNLYAVLSNSEFTPAPIASGLEPDTMAGALYDHLVTQSGWSEV
jgi:hypothetical protein